MSRVTQWAIKDDLGLGITPKDALKTIGIAIFDRWRVHLYAKLSSDLRGT